jgi:hypothetical protein
MCEEEAGHCIVLEDVSSELAPHHSDSAPHTASTHSDLSVRVSKLIGSPVCERCVRSDRLGHPSLSPRESPKYTKQDAKHRYPPFSLDLDDSYSADHGSDMPLRDDGRAPYDHSSDDELIKQLLQVTRECQQRNLDTNRLLDSHAKLLQSQLLAKKSNGSGLSGNSNAPISPPVSSDKQYMGLNKDEVMQSLEQDQVIKTDSISMSESMTTSISVSASVSESTVKSESDKALRAKIFAEKAEARMRLKHNDNNNDNNNDHDE